MNHDAIAEHGALFRRDGDDHYRPTLAARGAWDARLCHGAPIAALLAGRLAHAPGTILRLTVDFLAPVPFDVLRLELDDLVGGKRVQRQRARLVHGDRVVAEAQTVVGIEGSLELPPKALDYDSPFDPDAVPELSEPNRGAAAVIGHQGFDSESVIIRRYRLPDDHRIYQWISLALPVVDDDPLNPIEIAIVAADYAQAAVDRRLPFADWSYRNAEQTIHFARRPVGSWIGSRCDSVVQPVGAGFNAADLFDASGRVAQAASALVVETR